MGHKFVILSFVWVIGLVFFLEGKILLRLVFDIARKRSKRAAVSRFAICVHVLAGAMTACMSWGYFIEPYWVEVNHFTIETDKLNDTTFRIVQITDTHCDVKLRNEKKIVEIVNSLNADVVVFTGDSINEIKGDNIELVLGQFKAMMGAIEADTKLAVYGNWDRKLTGADYFGGTGFEVLENKTVRVEKDGEAIYFSGVGFGGRMNKSLVEDEPGENYSVLLYHTPDMIESLDGWGVDLYLCGHTHGGQVAMPFYGAIITYSKFGKKYEAGRYEVGGTTLYVNRGVGMEGGKAPRVRFCARPEVAVFDIVGK